MAEKKKTLKEEVESNISTNSKTILSIFGDIATLFIMVLIYAINGGMGLADMGFILLMGIKPYLVMLVNITTKGEVKDLETTNKLLDQKNNFLKERILFENEKRNHLKQIIHERDIAEWRIQLAAAEGRVRSTISGAADWDIANAQLDEVKEKGEMNGWDDASLNEKKRLLEKLNMEIETKQAKLDVVQEITEDSPKRDNLFPKTGDK
ncbi:MAG: hypothetical protein GY853_16405 [PVC group bacterium]|nr:hypothetical protein [PVC group bacterium]